jgi:hypothetical protein
MSRVSHEKELILGGEPRVNLLPPEVVEQAKDRLLRRKLLLATAGTVVLVLLAIGGAGVYTTSTTMQLAEAQAETAALLAEQSQYVAVRQVQAQVDTAHAARAVGGWTEIDWKAYLQGVRAALPADVGIDAVAVGCGYTVTPAERPRGDSHCHARQPGPSHRAAMVGAAAGSAGDGRCDCRLHRRGRDRWLHGGGHHAHQRRRLFRPVPRHHRK